MPNSGLETTLKLLAETRNEAAVGVLLAALDGPNERIQHDSLRALLKRNSPSGHAAIVGRWSQMDETWRQIVGEQRGRLAKALHDAILDHDDQAFANGCDAALFEQEFDLIGALTTVAVDRSNKHAPAAAETALRLAEKLFEKLSAPRDYRDRRDPQFVRRFALTALEKSVEQFASHHNEKLIAAFLILARRDDALLKRLLRDPSDAAYDTTIRLLSESQLPGIVRLLLSMLDDYDAPASALHVMARRCDPLFFHALIDKLSDDMTSHARSNLRRIDSFDWIENNVELFDSLSEEQQAAAVHLAVLSGIDRKKAMRVVERAVTHGKPAGRRAGSAALAGFDGAAANRLIQLALDDSDPRVVANAVAQIRDRHMTGAMQTLIEAIDSPHEAVREAARESLSDFNFDRYLAAFDTMDDAVRGSTGKLVKKVDRTTFSRLEAEMADTSRSRRSRAIAMTVAIDGIGDLEEAIIELLEDENHLVRIDAVKALGSLVTKRSREALRYALGDRSIAVQQAAEKCLAAKTGAAPVAPPLDVDSPGVADSKEALQ